MILDCEIDLVAGLILDSEGDNLVPDWVEIVVDDLCLPVADVLAWWTGLDNDVRIRLAYEIDLREVLSLDDLDMDLHT